MNQVEGNWKSGTGRATLILKNQTQLSGNWLAGDVMFVTKASERGGNIQYPVMKNICKKKAIS